MNEELKSFIIPIFERSILNAIGWDRSVELIKKSAVLSFVAGSRIPEIQKPDLMICLQGKINLYDRKRPSEKVGEVIPGRSIELGNVLEENPVWNCNWQAEDEVKLLKISGAAFRASLGEIEGLTNYLKRITSRPEIQKFKHNLSLFGGNDQDAISIISKLEFVDSSEIKPEELVIIREGSIEVQSPNNPIILVMGDSFFIPKNAENYKIVKESVAQVWTIPSKLMNFERAPEFLKINSITTLGGANTNPLLSNQKPPLPGDFIQGDGLDLEDFNANSILASEIKVSNKFPYIRQPNLMDCGAACAAMIAHFYSRPLTIGVFRQLIDLGREGATMWSLKQGLDRVGFKTAGINSGLTHLKKFRLPAIAHMNHHFVVIYKINDDTITLGDPIKGIIEKPIDKFKTEWSGLVLLVLPTPKLLRFPIPETARSRFKEILQPFKLDIVESLISVMAVSAFSLLFPIYLQSSIDKVLIDKEPNALNWITAAFLILSVFAVLFYWLRGRLMGSFVNRFNLLLISKFYSHFIRLPAHLFQSRPLGDFTSRFTELLNLRTRLSSSVFSLTFNLASIIVLSGILIAYSWQLFILISLILVFQIGITLFIGHLAQSELGLFRSAETESQSLISSHYLGIESLESIAATTASRWRWNHINDQAHKHRDRFEDLSNLQSASQFLFSGIVLLASLAFGLHLHLVGKFTLGQVAATIILSQLISLPVINFFSAYGKLEQINNIFNKLNDMWNLKIEPAANDLGKKSKEMRSINSKNICFQYRSESNRPAIDHVNINIKPEEMIAITGASGSGKSTLALILSGIYQSTSGELSLDDKNVSGNEHIMLRNHVTLVPQGASIFSGSVLDNIAFGETSAVFEKAVNAARLAEAHEFISKLPMSYATRLGQNGTDLSSGQRQRIALARAFYTGGNVFVLDEATAALDSITEKKIFQNIKNKMSKNTVIIVSHRLSTIRMANRILVMQAGKIVESGSHDQLISNHGIYYQLASKQSANL